MLEQTAIAKLRIAKAEPKYCLCHSLGGEIHTMVHSPLSSQPGSTIYLVKKITQILTKYFRYEKLLRYKSFIRYKSLLDFVAKVQLILQVTDI